jgi:hypothetical protein
MRIASSVEIVALLLDDPAELGGECRGRFLDRPHRLRLQRDRLQFAFPEVEQAVRSPAERQQRLGGPFDLGRFRRDSGRQEIEHLGLDIEERAQHMNPVDRFGQGHFAQQDATQRRRPPKVDQLPRIALAGERLLQLGERRQDAAAGRDPALHGSDTLGAQFFDGLEGAEDRVELGGDVVDLVDHLHVAVQDDDGVGRLVTARRDRVEDRRKLALAHAGGERAGQLDEL